jgi:hypothetical protein
MERLKVFLHSDKFIVPVLLFIVSAALYLPFVTKFGYYYDDWYLMYAAKARGASVFWDLFTIDRPLRALIMIPAYVIFGDNPIYHNISAFLFRFLGGASLLWILQQMWKEQTWVVMSAPLLFLVYPGFLSQPNGIDYQPNLVGLAMGLLSIALTIKAVFEKKLAGKVFLFTISILLGWFYLGQIEWYIGLEFLRFSSIFIIAFRSSITSKARVIIFFRWALPAFLIPGVFLIWRLFFFESQRGVTDVNLQFGGVLASPMRFLANRSITLLGDMVDVIFLAWVKPLFRLGSTLSLVNWLTGWGIAMFIIALIWIYSSKKEKLDCVQSVQWIRERREMFIVGVGITVFGLLPVVLVGRSANLVNLTRYTVVASVGTAIICAVILKYILNIRLRTLLLSLFVLSASLTHHANSIAFVQSTDATRNFWWQVSWRIPQMQIGTTLITYYSVAAEQDYFTWGPANLIYYPESTNERFAQPGIYAVLLNRETLEKVIAREPQEYYNRRSIRTYANYRNVLILTQPTPNSCIRIINRKQVELSFYEDLRIVEIAPYSEAELILLEEDFHTPPHFPFGPEPPHEWCYYYQKADLARQRGDWDEVIRLGRQAAEQGFAPNDPIEWMPFLQAHAIYGNVDRLLELAPLIQSDPYVAQQVCQIIGALDDISDPVREAVRSNYCLP